MKRFNKRNKDLIGFLTKLSFLIHAKFNKSKTIVQFAMEHLLAQTTKNKTRRIEIKMNKIKSMRK